LEDAINNPEVKTWEETDEDAIILINHIDNLGFDNYKSFDNYLTNYRDCLRKKPHQYYPHIDVRFKRSMLNNNNINDPLNHEPILDQMKLISDSKTKDNTPKIGIENKIDVFLKQYFRAYFLLKFYEKLNIAENNELYSQLVRYKNFNNSEAYADEKNEKVSPFYQKGNLLLVLKCSSKSNNKLMFDETTTIVELEILSKENLTNTIDDNVFPESWNPLLEITNQTAIENALKMLQISYSMVGTNDKLKLKEIITDTKKLVDSDLRLLQPNIPSQNTKYFLMPLTDYTKTINELI
jgi:hypothetical protein